MSRQVTFIGAGNMAEALVKGLVEGGYPAGRIAVTDTREERLKYFRDAFGVAGGKSNVEAARAAEVLFLAVKPQVFGEVLAELRGAIKRDALVISIAAGVRAARIEEALGEGIRVVRVMPNTPALVGAGVSAICAGRHASDGDLATAETLLKSVGVVVRVTESLMDAVTAVSGSGPAYVFYLMEAMLASAAGLGLDAGTARKLVIGTVAGAARLAAAADVGPEELRARVTSKGGTTAAAIGALDERGVKAALEEAIRAAERRSRELSGS